MASIGKSVMQQNKKQVGAKNHYHQNSNFDTTQQSTVKKDCTLKNEGKTHSPTYLK